MTDMTLAFCNRGAVPKVPVEAIWGARLIAPSDLVYDRQDLKAATDDAKSELMDWLNPEGGKAIGRMLDWLRENYWKIRGQSGFMAAVEDDDGVIFVGTNGPSGYVYATGYLKRHAGIKTTTTTTTTEAGCLSSS